MSGHSKWETTKRQKGANDAKRGAIFTKLSNQIAIAARSGTDPNMNPTLALAIEKAKAANVPNANIDRAIARVSDKSIAALSQETYEGIGPDGIGIIIEVATDNKNRTLPEVRNALSKNGGRMADAGSVMFQFEKRGVIRVSGTGEDILMEILDAGAEDAAEEDEEIVAYTDQKDVAKVRNNLLSKNLKINDAELQYVPKNYIEISDKVAAEKILKLLNAIDDLDDVVNVFTNANITADI
jgi:YebC/PmpR family DNA-binding regulatory protein